VSRLVVWGGDGTFHRVVKALWERNALERMELALVPVGTCNDLARRFGLTLKDGSRWDAVSPAGRLIRIPLGRMSWKGSPIEDSSTGDDLFVNNAGFGRPSSCLIKRKALSVLWRMNPVNVTARWSFGCLTGRYFMGLAVLSPYFSGGLCFEPQAPSEDGAFRMYLVPARGKIRLVGCLFRGRMGIPLFDSKVTKITATDLILETDTYFYPQADGEPSPKKPVRWVRFETLPQTVKLWIP